MTGQNAPSESECSHAGLFFLDFRQRFAVDAQRGRGARFEAAHADLDAALFAVAVLILLDQLNGAVDFLDQFAFAVAGAQL